MFSDRARDTIKTLKFVSYNEDSDYFAYMFTDLNVATPRSITKSNSFAPKEDELKAFDETDISVSRLCLDCRLKWLVPAISTVFSDCSIKIAQRSLSEYPLSAKTWMEVAPRTVVGEDTSQLEEALTRSIIASMCPNQLFITGMSTKSWTATPIVPSFPHMSLGSMQFLLGKVESLHIDIEDAMGLLYFLPDSVVDKMYKKLEAMFAAVPNLIKLSVAIVSPQNRKVSILPDNKMCPHLHFMLATWKSMGPTS